MSSPAPVARGSRPRRGEVVAAVVASDPGLLRLRLASRAVVAVGVASFVLHWLGPALGVQGVVAMLLGGMVGLNGAFATSGRSPLDAARTVAGLPVVAALTVSLAAVLKGHRLATLVVFVLVMVAATFVRRYGPRFFNYGMVGWLTYFFTTFVGFGPSQIGAVLAVIATASACVLLAALVLPDRPEALLRAALRAFDLRLEDLLDLLDDALRGAVPVDRVAARVHGTSFRVLEAALIVDGYLGQSPGGGGLGPSEVRHNLVDSELAADELGTAVVALVAGCRSGWPGDVADRAALRAVLAALRARSGAEARRLASELRHAVEDRADLPDDALAGLRRATSAVPALVDGWRQAHVDVPAHVGDYQPAVTMFLGNLPGTAPSASAALAARPDPGPAGRLSQNTRLCLQVAVATSLTIVAGDALSANRYYWAVLACFLSLTGTFTPAEIVVKGGGRIVGTVVGLVVATITVHFTGQHDSAIVAVMLVCVFLGLYFFRVSYAVMAFAITTVMGQLYNVLHEFSTDLLTLRLAETAIGAGIGMVVPLVVLPLRTSDVASAAQATFLSAVDDVIAEVDRRLSGSAPSVDLLLESRRVDAALHQLALVRRPLGGATLLGITGRRARAQVGAYSTVAFKARAVAAAAAVVGGPAELDAGRVERLLDDLVDTRNAVRRRPEVRTSESARPA